MMKSTAKLLIAVAAALVLATGAHAQEADTDAASNLGTAVVGASQGGFLGGADGDRRGLMWVFVAGVGWVLMADESQDTVPPDTPPEGTPQPVPPPHHGTTPPHHGTTSHH